MDRRTLHFGSSLAILAVLFLCLPGPVSAEPPTLLGTHLSLSTPAPLRLLVDGTSIVVTSQGIALPAPLEDPKAEADRRLARRGGIMASFGVPVLISGVALSISAAALPNSDSCGEPINRKAIGAAGAVLGGVGIGFTAAGFRAIRQASRGARKSRSRGTRTAMALLGTFGAFGILASAFAVPFATMFCSD